MADFGVVAHERADTVVLALRGDLDGRAGATLGEGYATAASRGPRAIVLDFADVGYINSTGIAVIVGLLAQARAAAISVHAIGLNEHYRHIFEITRLADFMTFFGSEDEAVGEGTTAAPA